MFTAATTARCFWKSIVSIRFGRTRINKNAVRKEEVLSFCTAFFIIEEKSTNPAAESGSATSILFFSYHADKMLYDQRYDCYHKPAAKPQANRF